MSPTNRVLLAVGSSVILTAVAHGQAFNIDCWGTQNNTPSDGYGAGAGQAGFWSPTLGLGENLFDIHGMITEASFTCAGGGGIIQIPGAAGDDERLMESVLLVGATAPTAVRGLRAGRYDVYVYSWLPRDSGTRTVTIFASNGDGTTQVQTEYTYGGTWPGQQVLNETYGKLTIDVIDGRNFIGLFLSGGGAKELTNAINGIQVVPVPAPGATALALGLAALSLRRRR